MNYIKKLESLSNSQINTIDAAKAEIYGIMYHLRSSKLTGEDLDGGRKDWISTKDVETRLQIILDKLNGLY